MNNSRIKKKAFIVNFITWILHLFRNFSIIKTCKLGRDNDEKIERPRPEDEKQY